MKFTCSRKELYDKLINIQRTVSAKSTVPALEGILLKAYNGKLSLCSYDLDVGTTTEMNVNVSEEGEIVLKAKILVDAISKLPEEIVEISVNDKLYAHICSGNVRYQLMGISSNDFPDLPTFEHKNSVKINGEMLKNMIRQVKFAISDNNRKPVYTGALFEIKDKVFTIVAVDGYKLALRKENVNNECDAKFIVPGKTLNEVLKFNTEEKEDIEMIIGHRHITFKINDYYLISRLLDGIFMDYNSIIPKESVSSFTIKRSSIIESLERMLIIGFEKIASPLTCTIEPDMIKFNSVTAIGRVDDILPIELKGSNMTIGFNSKYLLDAFRNADTDEVRLELKGPNQPLKILPLKGDSFIFIVLPMRL